MESNPYAPPVANIAPPLPDTGIAHLEAIRREHLKVESTIKTAGVLFCLGAIVLLFTAGSIIFNLAKTTLGPLPGAMIIVILGLIQGATGIGLRRLQPWSRIPAIILSAIGLLAFPLGTIINALILINIAGKKGKRILSSDYKDIVAMTPHVKQKTSIWVIILLVILAIFLIGIVAVAVIPNLGKP